MYALNHKLSNRRGLLDLEGWLHAENARKCIGTSTSALKGGAAIRRHNQTAESVGGAANEHPIETVNRQETDDGSSPHQSNGDFSMHDDEQEIQGDPKGRRPSRDGAAREEHYAPENYHEEEEYTDHARRRYRFRPRAPVVYRDARAYAPWKRQHRQKKCIARAAEMHPR